VSRLSRSLKVIRTDTNRSATYEFQLHSLATVVLSRIVSEINGDFSRKSQIFPTQAYFAPPLKGFPLKLYTGARGQKARMMGLPGRERSLTISSAIWVQYTNVTDGQTNTGRQQRPSLRMASRGKNYASWILFIIFHQFFDGCLQTVNKLTFCEHMEDSEAHKMGRCVR